MPQDNVTLTQGLHIHDGKVYQRNVDGTETVIRITKLPPMPARGSEEPTHFRQFRRTPLRDSWNNRRPALDYYDGK